MENRDRSSTEIELLKHPTVKEKIDSNPKIGVQSPTQLCEKQRMGQQWTISLRDREMRGGRASG